jgi:hypothetical protein
MPTLKQYVEAAKRLDAEELEIEFKVSSNRFRAAKTAYRAGRIAHMDLTETRARFQAARGVRYALAHWGAV